MLPHFVYELEENIIDFESAIEILMKEDYKMVVKTRFERIYNRMEGKSYIKHEDIPENKEIFVYGFRHIQADKVDNYILIGCESAELYENNILLNFWSNKIICKENEMRSFKKRMFSYD